MNAPLGIRTPNKFGATCPVCNRYVANRAGFAVRESDGRRTYCADDAPPAPAPPGPPAA